ncbi:MAG: glycosyltransferase [Desulfomonile tiedjei]|nr:glycosyltransferase [Desulfomonile tiedjei]
MDHTLVAVAVAVLLFQIYFWAVGLRGLLQSLLWIPGIRPGGNEDSSEDFPLISVIVPAHNEQATIEECVRSVLEQDYPRYELILVDDRSEDRTASIASDLARGRSNFKIVTVRELAQGWTGKCHALDVGVGYASGKWLAFLDADSTLHSSALRQCYQAALKHQVSMVTLSPKFILKSFWEKALQPAFAVASSILFPLPQINDPASPVASANGMFFLISRDAYDKIGGHHDVKGLAVEDIGIGKRVKASGLGLLFLNGRHLLQTRMYEGFQATLDGWTRILCGSMNYEVTTVVRHLVIHTLMSPFAAAFALYMFVPAAQGLFPNTWFVLPLIFAAELLVIPPWFCSQLGIPKRYCVLMCLGNLFLTWTFLVMIKKILMKDALQWRGTTYENHLYQPTGLNPATRSREVGSVGK